MKSSTTKDRLNYLMQSRGLKQVDILNMAKACGSKYGVKFSKSDLSQYVSGKVEPNQDKLYVLSKALSVDVSWLMGYDTRAAMPRSSNMHVSIPVLGLVRAGLPMDAVENIIDYEEIPEELAKQGDFFALKITGESMEPKFSDGDVVIVKKQPDVESGEIAIALINGDAATIKKVLKFDGGINLVPSNPVYDVRTYTNEQIEALPVSILGKVVELRAKF